MRWIESVKTPGDPDLTRWNPLSPGVPLPTGKPESASGLKPSKLHWESVGGLPTQRGGALLSPDPFTHRQFRLTSSYEFWPGVLAALEWNQAILGGIVTREAPANLDRSGTL